MSDIENFDGEMSDVDVYNVLVQSGMFTKEDLSLEEFLVMADLIKAKYDPNEALIMAKGYGIVEKYRQS